MGIDRWTVAEAKAKLSEVIEKARVSGPQTITRNGRDAVVVSSEEWETRSGRRGTLAEFFAASPFREAEVEIERIKGGPRDVDL